MCGIFGQVSNDASKINIDKISILGIMNETRGTSSCGLFLNDDIYTGTGSMSKFRDFISFHRNTEITTPVVIGHTRQASVGVISEANAHPFGFGTDAVLNYTFIGAHNGTLHNYEEIANKRDINLRPSSTVKGVTTSRNKIDSEVLLESIYKDGNYSVLEEYNGGAALAMFNVVDNTVMLYSGASAKSSYAPTVVEERPLHVYIVDENTFYFSSEADPLEAIAGYENVEKIQKVPFNKVFIISNGDFKNAEVVDIDRSKMLQTKITAAVGGGFRRPGSSIPRTNYGHRDYGYYEDDIEDCRNYGHRASSPTTTNSRVRTMTSSTSNIVEVTEKDMNDSYTAASDLVKNSHARHGCSIVHGIGANGETTVLGNHDVYGDIPYHKDFRFGYKNEQNMRVFLTGVFIHVFGYGLIYTGKTIKETFHFYRENKNKMVNLYTGEIEKYDSRKPKGVYRDLFDPSIKSVKDINPYYFYKGYLLMERADYMMCITPETEHVVMENHTKLTISPHKISHMTVFPVKSTTGLYIKDAHVYEEASLRHPLLDFAYTFTRGHISRIELKEACNYNLYVFDVRQTKMIDPNAFTPKDEKELVSKICGSMAHPIFNESDVSDTKNQTNMPFSELSVLTEIIEAYENFKATHDFYYQLGMILAASKVDLTKIIEMVDSYIEDENDSLNKGKAENPVEAANDLYLLIALKKSLINYKKNY